MTVPSRIFTVTMLGFEPEDVETGKFSSVMIVDDTFYLQIDAIAACSYILAKQFKAGDEVEIDWHENPKREGHLLGTFKGNSTCKAHIFYITPLALKTMQ